MNKKENLLPRLIRLRDIPHYLGMDKHRFDKEVRPNLVEIPIGIQGIAFDRLDLDAWVDYYKKCSGRLFNKGVKLWDAKKHQGYKNVVTPGISTKKSSDYGFAKALELTLSKKQKNTWQNV